MLTAASEAARRTPPGRRTPAPAYVPEDDEDELKRQAVAAAMALARGRADG